jgi:CPA2 family monovalent cation:H+ antiporter-2
VTLAQLAITVALLAGLGVVASRFGLSAIPAYITAGLLLGPNEPKVISLIRPSEVTDFVAEIGIVFLLFFLGLEFTLARFLRSGRHLGLGGLVDLVLNTGIGLLVGLLAFGASFGTIVIAAAVYVSSSAIAVKGLIDFRRLADDETDLVLAILLFEDLAIAFLLAFVAGGGGEGTALASVAAKVLLFVAASLAAARWLSRPLDRALDALPREFFLLFVVAFVVGAAALAHELQLSEAVGALMAGVVLAETSVRELIEDRFFSFRDLFGALFFFVFGLSIDVAAIGNVWWLLVVAVLLTIIGKVGAVQLAGPLAGLSRRQSLNAGVALIAHGEFTIIVAQLAAMNPRLGEAVRADIVAFAGLYVLATAVVGIVLMKESKAIGRRIFGPPRLVEES